jgi:formate C-acetyltransferase
VTEYIKNQLDFFVNKRAHHALRKEIPFSLDDIAGDEALSLDRRATKAHERVLDNEKVVVFPNEKIAGTRIMLRIPDYPHPPAKYLGRRISHMLNEPSIGGISNNAAYYERVITAGLESVREDIKKQLAIEDRNAEEADFLENQLCLIDVLEKFGERFRDAAKKVDNETVYQSFCHIPQNGARNFLEALQFLRFLNFALRYENPTHTPFGRFDQYMYPFLKHDRDSGMSYDEASELVCDFFISLNRDSDIYFGIQQGDNGQAMVLGGVDANGNCAYNELSEICIKTSLELGVIDPKINLRVDKNTPFDVYRLGSRLTKKGLGFPQYSNDDVVIPALVSFGYEMEDACDYAVAGCWEFIIPNYGAEGINYEAMPFARLVTDTMNKHLANCESFSRFMELLEVTMDKEMKEIDNAFHHTPARCSPMNSLLSKQALQKCCDVSKCGKYANFGIHGPGIATAVDSLAVIKKYVFEEKSIAKEELIEAVSQNFEGFESLWRRLRFEAPKMGNDDDYADDIAIELMEMYARVVSKYKNGEGGVYRPGTGSAMYYMWSAQDMGASPDGRKAGEPLPANYSPSLNIKLNGPISMFKSFCKPDLKKVCNGGPVTLELHESVFRNDEAIDKVAGLVQAFVDLGGHQLQLNAVNAETLRNAQEKPEEYRNLVVRVWGWSGYFVELSREYQDHIMSRAALSV